MQVVYDREVLNRLIRYFTAAGQSFKDMPKPPEGAAATASSGSEAPTTSSDHTATSGVGSSTPTPTVAGGSAGGGASGAAEEDVPIDLRKHHMEIEVDASERCICVRA